MPFYDSLAKINSNRRARPILVITYTSIFSKNFCDFLPDTNIHEYKTVKEGKRIAVKKWFDEKKDYNLLACSWEDIFYFPNLLLEEGYEFRELPCENFTYELLKGDRRVTLYTREIPKGDIQGMVQAIDEVNEYSKGEDLYIVSALENQDYLFNKLSVSGKVRKQMDRLYKVN